MLELANILGGGSTVVRSPITNFKGKIWYDNEHDFYHLAFAHNNHSVDIQFYKVLSYRIDGNDGWIGCPRGQVYDFASSILKRVYNGT